GMAGGDRHRHRRQAGRGVPRCRRRRRRHGAAEGGRGGRLGVSPGAGPAGEADAPVTKGRRSLAGGPSATHNGGVTIRVFLLDDHELVRRGVRDLLWAEDDINVVGEASNGEEALDRIPQTHPDVAVLDVRLGDESGDRGGIEVCREIRSAHPEVACVMLTSFADDEALFASILAGAAGYVLKQIRGGDLVNAIRRVARGESLLDPAVTARVLSGSATPTARTTR